ncbi:hypothetical protein VTO73DRAFT_8366 [Trametes versicolor]
MAGTRALGATLRADYARREIKIRGELRQAIQELLVALTGVPEACMRWTLEDYCEYVYLAYGLKLVGWPKGMVFRNLSNVTGLVAISGLANRWKHGKMGFAAITEAERAAALLDPRAAAPATHCKHRKARTGRSDLKAHRPSRKPRERIFPVRHVRDGPTSDKYVTAAAEAQAEVDEDPIESPADGDPFWSTRRVLRRRFAELEEDPIESWD